MATAKELEKQMRENGYGLALLASLNEATINTQIKDTGYGCGSSFITIKTKNRKLLNWLKATNQVEHDAYYGWILKPIAVKKFMGTLEQETFNQELCKCLDKRLPELHAFTHTYLT